MTEYTDKLDPERTDYPYLSELAASLVGTVSRQEWLEALESGEYKQHRGMICDLPDDPRAFCCLGVAARLAKVPFRLNKSLLQSEEAGMLIQGMTTADCDKYAIPLNDGFRGAPLEDDPRFTKGATFPEIADFFRQKWDMPK